MECRTPRGDKAGNPSRRVLLAAAAVAGLGLSGCSLRWESDAGDLPVLQTQAPPSDQRLLLSTRASLVSLVEAYAAADPASNRWIAPLTRAHRTQLNRVTRVAAGAGIEVSRGRNGAEPSGSTPTTAPADSSASASSRPSPADLARAELRLPARHLEDAWAVRTDRRAMVVTIGVARAGAALLLDPKTSLPRGAAPSAAVARVLLNAVVPATHGLETITARTPAKERTRGEATLRWLWSARTDLEAVAGGDLEYTDLRLPGTVDGSGAASTAARLSADVVTACASQIGAAAGGTAAQRAWLVRLWAHAEADRCRWSGTPQPFPGLRDQNA